MGPRECHDFSKSFPRRGTGREATGLGAGVLEVTDAVDGRNEVASLDGLQGKGDVVQG
jgi:hypothetical protein